jgi:hypothetical protein
MILHACLLLQNIYKGPFGQKITISIVIQFEKLKKAPIRLQFVSLMLLFMHTLISDEKREEMKLIWRLD